MEQQWLWGLTSKRQTATEENITLELVTKWWKLGYVPNQKLNWKPSTPRNQISYTEVSARTLQFCEIALYQESLYIHFIFLFSHKDSCQRLFVLFFFFVLFWSYKILRCFLFLYSWFFPHYLAKTPFASHCSRGKPCPNTAGETCSTSSFPFYVAQHPLLCSLGWVHKGTSWLCLQLSSCSHTSNRGEIRAIEEFFLSPLYFAALPKTQQVRKTDLPSNL